MFDHKYNADQKNIKCDEHGLFYGWFYGWFYGLFHDILEHCMADWNNKLVLFDKDAVLKLLILPFLRLNWWKFPNLSCC